MQQHQDLKLSPYNLRPQLNIDKPLIEFNKQQINIQFTIEKVNNSINFLDLSIHRKKTKLDFAIYRKHTQTGIVIPNDSCHPHEAKHQALITY